MTSDGGLGVRLADAVRRDWLERGTADRDLDPRTRIAGVVAREAPLLAEAERQRLIETVASGVLGLGVIEELLADPAVTDVLVNGPGPIWLERSGQLERSGVVIGMTEIHRCIERLVAPLGLRADRSNPVVDARLADGTRVNVVLPPLAPDGPLIAIRRHPRRSFGLTSFAPGPVAGIIQRIAGERLNVIVYGATGSGKTSLVNSMAESFSRDERIVVIEDTSELVIPGTHVVRLESRPPSMGGRGGASIRDLVRVSLRLRPDRLIVGEVRGAEAVDMIWAMSTGHRGSVSTCHAASARDALMRVETMMLLAESNLSVSSVRAQIHSAVDVLIGMGRAGGAQRQVTGIHLLGSDGSIRPLRPAGGALSG